MKRWLFILLTVLFSLGLPAWSAEAPTLMQFGDFRSTAANVVEFAPVQAQVVRIAILKSSSGQPCIDELEIYGPGSEKNLGLAANGGVAGASSCLSGHARHRIEHLNDGLYTNDHSWICAEATGWVQIKLPASATINRVVLSRDRNGTLTDRSPVEFDVLVSPDGNQWTTVKQYRSSTAFSRRYARLNPVALRRALDDLAAMAPDRYPDLPELRRQVDAIPATLAGLLGKVQLGDAATIQAADQLLELEQRILMANPLLDFDKILLVRRGTGNLGLPINFHSNSSIPVRGYDNQIQLYSLHQKKPLATVLTTKETRFAGDLCLHFDADRFLFSMPNDKNLWQIFECKIDGTGLRQVTPDMATYVHNYDACYLPNGEILFTSTASMGSVPCDSGSSEIANIFRLSADGKIRQLCFDQEHNWTPRIMDDGTVLYQRWEYTDTPHSNTRLLFTMHPDGTNQRAIYGSNSYWPTSFFYANPIPGKPSQVVGIASGHHGLQRMGELIILDTAKGRHEGDGIVQRIPGFGKKVEARIADRYADGSWPRFLHPCPLSDKYFLVSCQPTPDDNWGLYLVDIYDNLLLIQEENGYAMLEPVALKKRPVPPVIPDVVDLKSKIGTIFLQNLYEGPGLKGVPKGTVKSLRIATYTFSYRGVGGLYGTIGMDGPWDIKRVLGTVPVYPDGSAKFTVPANVPIFIQPLDSQGQALALMRSWMTAMPGEVLSCVGCHEESSMVPLSRNCIAFQKEASTITPWRPVVTGFSFEREVQPVLDKYCVSCHNGAKDKPDFSGGKRITDWNSRFGGNGGFTGYAGKFTTSYCNLFPFVRNNGIESDYHLLVPMEFHFSTSELGKMLRKGHHNVRLDPDAWDRLVTWDDMNRPFHGSWSSMNGTRMVEVESVRAKMRSKYANVDENHELQLPKVEEKIVPVMPEPLPPIKNPDLQVVGWPFSTVQSRPATSSLDFGNGLSLELVQAPAGTFIMGSTTGHRDEQPICEVKIKKPFRIGKFEITNAQYRQFDPTHDSRVADAISYQFGQRPWSLNEDSQPVCRVSWRQAMEYCAWLSKKTGKKVSLPTEAQWEWACRAGSDLPYSFGDATADYAPYANLGDIQLKKFATDTTYAPNGELYVGMRLISNPGKYDDYIPKDEKHDDGNQLSVKPGSYKPNAWGLHDMHGNVAEWTRSLYQPYPYKDDKRNDPKATGERVVRGGSWWTRPFQGTNSYRLPYQDYQPVMDVGFRIVVEE